MTPSTQAIVLLAGLWAVAALVTMNKAKIAPTIVGTCGSTNEIRASPTRRFLPVTVAGTVEHHSDVLGFQLAAIFSRQRHEKSGGYSDRRP